LLKASTPYNTTLVLAINSLIFHNIDAHVLHILGINNQVADTLSCFNNALALHLVPGLKLGFFKNQQVLLGVLKK
jgi:hypothetical protein